MTNVLRRLVIFFIATATPSVAPFRLCARYRTLEGNQSDRDSKTLAAWPLMGLPTTSVGGREFDLLAMLASIKQPLKSPQETI